MEQVTFFNKLRTEYPDTWGAIALHPRNEQKLRGGQHRALIRQKAEGMTPGASDVIIPGRVSFVCEIKRQDHTKSKWQPNQIEYLIAAQNAGAFACVALGWEGAWEAFSEWVSGN
jgi:Holliday junction resolvase